MFSRLEVRAVFELSYARQREFSRVLPNRVRAATAVEYLHTYLRLSIPNEFPPAVFVPPTHDHSTKDRETNGTRQNSVRATGRDGKSNGFKARTRLRMPTTTSLKTQQTTAEYGERELAAKDPLVW